MFPTRPASSISGRGLAARGFELVSTGGTARALADAGLAVTSVSDVTGFPEMMDGRVKTLHPALHGGILARRDRPDDLAALERHGIGLVDVVVVNLYPFAKAAANPATPFDALVEEIDIGGPSLVRAAAKNFRGVLVVVDPARLPAAAARRSTRAPTLGVPLRADAEGVRAHRGVRHGDRARRWRRSTSTAIGSSARAATARVRPTSTRRRSTSRCERSATCATARTRIRGRRGTSRAGRGRRVRARRRGRSCRARSCRTRTCSISTRRRASCSSSTSRPPSSSSTRTRAARRPATSAADAYVRAREADSLAAFGGIVALNRPIDVADGRGDRLDVHRSGRSRRRSTTARATCSRARRTCAS